MTQKERFDKLTDKFEDVFTDIINVSGQKEQNNVLSIYAQTQFLAETLYILFRKEEEGDV
jgi:CTP:phosphocholine cytidylyltransferase-like protein